MPSGLQVDPNELQRIGTTLCAASSIKLSRPPKVGPARSNRPQPTGTESRVRQIVRESPAPDARPRCTSDRATIDGKGIISSSLTPLGIKARCHFTCVGPTGCWAWVLHSL